MTGPADDIPNLVDAESGELILACQFRRWTPEAEERLGRFIIPAPYTVDPYGPNLPGIWLPGPSSQRTGQWITRTPLYITRLFRDEAGDYFAELTWRQVLDRDDSVRSKVVSLYAVKSGRTLGRLMAGNLSPIAPGAAGGRIEWYLETFREANTAAGLLPIQAVKTAPDLPAMSTTDMWKQVESVVSGLGAFERHSEGAGRRGYMLPLTGGAEDDELYVSVTAGRPYASLSIDHIGIRDYRQRAPFDDEEDWYREHVDPYLYSAFQALPAATRRRHPGWYPRGGDVYATAEPVARMHVPQLLKAWVEQESAWHRMSTAAGDPDGAL